jgi:MFS family permease
MKVSIRSVLAATLCWALAVLSAYSLATLFATQSVISHLADMNIPLSMGERLEMSAKDQLGMTSLYLPLIAVGMLIAMLVAGWLGRRNPQRRTHLFMLAGAVAMLSIHLALNWSFDITLVAVARSPLGLLSQALAGAVGGYLFTRLKKVST